MATTTRVDGVDPDATLQDDGSGDAGGRDGEPRALYLTVLWHPDASRVGDVAAIGTSCALSRMEPAFLPPGGGGGGPLADRHMSRRPITITAAPDGSVLVEPGDVNKLAVDGAVCAGAADIDAARAARGATLECGRTALLLHSRRPPSGIAARHGLVGASEAIEAVCTRVDQVADLDVSVLLTGPSGSGKELIAQAIHRASRRREGPFVAVSAATQAAATAPSQLFGHVRGAFTGADRAHPGLFVAADRGTLFLDEIGETSPEVQAMLLRVLEEKAVLAVGATAARPVDVRLIAATDADLDADTASGRFKLPLLHRLQGFTIALPALRQRRDDIGRLLVHFLREELAAAGEPDRLADASWLPASLVAALCRHDWPGNVRELRNIARHVVISNRGQPRIAVDELLAGLGGVRAVAPGADPVAAPRASRRRPADIGEDELIEALRAHRWATGAAAAALGISRTSLYALMERSERLRKGRDLSAEEIRDSHRASGGDLERMAEILQVSEHALKLRIRELGIVLS